MTLLAGFDMVIEISRSALEGLVQAASLGGQSLSAPTEVKQSVGKNSVDLMILQPISLVLSPGAKNWATIEIPFEDSTFSFGGTTLGPVTGTLSVAGTFDVLTVDGTDPSTPPFVAQVAFFPRLGGVSHNFDTSVSYCAAAVDALADRAAFEATMDLDLGVALSANPLPAGPIWIIDPTQNGTLGGRFCNLTVDVIGPDSVGLFGILLTENERNGDTSQSSSALAKGDNIAVSLSLRAFHDLVWCPQWAGAAAGALSNQPAKLAQFVSENAPPDCGSGVLPMAGGVYLNGISCQFDDGVIHVGGNAYRGNEGAYCFRVDISFQADLVIDITGGKLQPVLSSFTSHKSIDVSWYCALLYLVAAAVGGAVSLAIVVFVYGAVTALIDIVASMQPIPAVSPKPVAVGFAGIDWTSVDISAEGLTLHGLLPALVPDIGPGRQATLVITADQTSTYKVGSGTYHYPGSRVCPPEDFPYDEEVIDLSVRCIAQTTMIGSPRTFAWQIGDSPPVVLSGSSGKADVNAFVALPAPDGVYQQLGQKVVSLSYEISPDGSTLTLTDANHLVYSLLVRVDCSDASGASVAAWQEVGIVGDVIGFGSDKSGESYADFMAKCMMATRGLLDLMRSVPETVARGGDPGELTEAQLVSVLAQGMRENLPGLGAAMSEICAVGGPAMRLGALRQVAGGPQMSFI